MKSIVLHPTLAEKLKTQKAKYQKVTAFADMLPIFSKNILEGEHTGDSYCKLANHHGKMYFSWGINWYTDKPINYPEDRVFPGGLVNVYINTHSLFNEMCSNFAHAELTKILPEIKVHFFDHWNTTFYFLPEESEAGLNRLERWFIETQSKCADYLKEKRRKELQKELETLS